MVWILFACLAMMVAGIALIEWALIDIGRTKAEMAGSALALIGALGSSITAGILIGNLISQAFA